MKPISNILGLRICRDTLKGRLFFLIVALFLHINGSTQTNAPSNWLVYFGNQKINNSWNIQSDFQYRTKQVVEQQNQTILRAGLGYNLSPNNHNILLGLAYVNTTFDDEVVVKSKIEEKRIYQQYLYKKNSNNFFTSHRVRLEERFFPSEFGLRARYFVALQKSLNQKGLNKHSVYGSIFNEFFVDIINANFDRNRLYAGLGYAINNDIRIESGYLIQSQKNNTRGQLQFVLYNNLSL